MAISAAGVCLGGRASSMLGMWVSMEMLTLMYVPLVGVNPGRMFYFFVQRWGGLLFLGGW